MTKLLVLATLLLAIACTQEPPTGPTPTVVEGDSERVRCLTDGHIWKYYPAPGWCDTFRVTLPTTTPPTTTEPAEGIDSIGRVEAELSGRYWNTSVTWTPSTAVASCSWSATGGAYVTSGQQSSTNIGRCVATVRGTPSGGDSVAVVVTDAEGEEYRGTRYGLGPA